MKNNVALLIPHYNNPEGLIKSINSIDDIQDIDVFVIDDGSEEEKIDEIKTNKFFKNNGQIFFFYLKQNQGIEHALNEGINQILQINNYKYTARLDCGDLCEKDRFYKQRKFLDENLDVKLLGTNVKAQNQDGKFLYTLKFPQKHKDIKNKMYINAMFIHPTVMFVNEIFNEIGKYPTNYNAAEDFALFFKIVKKYKTANLAETLVTIEINEKGITKTKRKIQVLNRIRIIQNHFYFGFWPIYGLFRNYFLLVIPNSIIEKIKILVK